MRVIVDLPPPQPETLQIIHSALYRVLISTQAVIPPKPSQITTYTIPSHTHNIYLLTLSFPASLTSLINLSTSLPTSHPPPLHPNTAITSSRLPKSLASNHPRTPTTVRTIAASPSKTMTSHTLDAASMPRPPPGPRNSVRSIGSKIS